MSESPVITSRRHALVKELADIRDDRDSPLMFMEGPRLVQEVLNSNVSIDMLVWTSSAETENVFKLAHEKAKKKLPVAESVFKAISDVNSPQGILAIARCPRWTWQDLVGRMPAPLVILDGVQDPGNVATIVRTAEAAGAAGIVTTPGTVHLFSPKALRGAMGSSLRLPCLQHISVREIAKELHKNSIYLMASTMLEKNKGKSPSRSQRMKELPQQFTQINWKMAVAILFGGEGQGISADWDSEIQQSIFVPMQPPVESLNVAAAAAVILYESFRRRAELL
jgi:TrmH family RNA methyltransferase